MFWHSTDIMDPKEAYKNIYYRPLFLQECRTYTNRNVRPAPWYS